MDEFDWDELQVIKDPDAKQVEVSFIKNDEGGTVGSELPCVRILAPDDYFPYKDNSGHFYVAYLYEPAPVEITGTVTHTTGGICEPNSIVVPTEMDATSTFTIPKGATEVRVDLTLNTVLVDVSQTPDYKAAYTATITSVTNGNACGEPQCIKFWAGTSVIPDPEDPGPEPEEEAPIEGDNPECAAQDCSAITNLVSEQPQADFSTLARLHQVENATGADESYNTTTYRIRGLDNSDTVYGYVEQNSLWVDENTPTPALTTSLVPLVLADSPLCFPIDFASAGQSVYAYGFVDMENKAPLNFTLSPLSSLTYGNTTITYTHTVSGFIIGFPGESFSWGGLTFRVQVPIQNDLEPGGYAVTVTDLTTGDFYYNRISQENPTGSGKIEIYMGSSEFTEVDCDMLADPTGWYTLTFQTTIESYSSGSFPCGVDPTGTGLRITNTLTAVTPLGTVSHTQVLDSCVAGDGYATALLEANHPEGSSTASGYFNRPVFNITVPNGNGSNAYTLSILDGNPQGNNPAAALSRAYKNYTPPTYCERIP